MRPRCIQSSPVDFLWRASDWGTELVTRQPHGSSSMCALRELQNSTWSNVEGGPPKRLQVGTPNASNPFWSADGQSIYFSTEPTGAIWKVPAEGGARGSVDRDRRRSTRPASKQRTRPVCSLTNKWQAMNRCGLRP